MQFSIAQSAARSFSSFTDAHFENSDLALWAGPDTHWTNGFKYLSDELDLWLLSGAAHDVCSRRYDVFLQAVIIVIANKPYDAALYPDWESLLPPSSQMNREKDHTVALDEDEYDLPNFLSTEYFDFVGCLTDEQRKARIEVLLNATVVPVPRQAAR